MTDQTECLNCDGKGRIWNNADQTSGQFFDCEACHGAGLRRLTMTGPDLRRIRTTAGLSLDCLAKLLRIGDLSTIHRWEKGDRKVSGPASIVLEMLSSGELPTRYMAKEMK